jgi:hypothetical protein
MSQHLAHIRRLYHQGQIDQCMCYHMCCCAIAGEGIVWLND